MSLFWGVHICRFGGEIRSWGWHFQCKNKTQMRKMSQISQKLLVTRHLCSSVLGIPRLENRLGWIQLRSQIGKGEPEKNKEILMDLSLNFPHWQPARSAAHVRLGQGRDQEFVGRFWWEICYFFSSVALIFLPTVTHTPYRYMTLY